MPDQVLDASKSAAAQAVFHMKYAVWAMKHVEGRSAALWTQHLSEDLKSLVLMAQTHEDDGEALGRPSTHVVDAGDGVCGDCLWCEDNADQDCINPDDPKCNWCGHCLGNHTDKP